MGSKEQSQTRADKKEALKDVVKDMTTDGAKVVCTLV